MARKWNQQGLEKGEGSGYTAGFMMGMAIHPLRENISPQEVGKWEEKIS